MTCFEVEYRMQRLLDEASRERLLVRRAGFRRRVGAALIAIGIGIRGSEPAPHPSSVMQVP